MSYILPSDIRYARHCLVHASYIARCTDVESVREILHSFIIRVADPCNITLSEEFHFKMVSNLIYCCFRRIEELTK